MMMIILMLIQILAYFKSNGADDEIDADIYYKSNDADDEIDADINIGLLSLSEVSEAAGSEAKNCRPLKIKKG